MLPNLPLLLIMVLFGLGCQSSGPTVVSPVRAQRAASIPVLIGGVAVGWAELTPYLAESGGRKAIEELILDRELARRTKSAGLRITSGLINQERMLFDAGATGSPEATAQIRRNRGLGTHRFNQLLRRNASLRALAGPAQPPTGVELRVAYELKFGARRVLRVMVLPDAARLGQIRARLQSGPSAAGLEWEFSRIAFEESVDPSAAAGGLLGAVHEMDPILPEAVRQMLHTTPDGELSTIVLTQAGALLVLPIRTTQEPATSLEDARAGLLDEIRIRRQRSMMDTLAREILTEARPTILDPGLNWAWESAQSGR